MRCDALRRGAMRRSRARVRGAGDARDRSRFLGFCIAVARSDRRGAARRAARCARVGAVDASCVNCFMRFWCTRAAFARGARTWVRA